MNEGEVAEVIPETAGGEQDTFPLDVQEEAGAAVTRAKALDGASSQPSGEHLEHDTERDSVLEKQEKFREQFTVLCDEIHKTLSEETPEQFTIVGGVRKLLRQPGEYLKRREALRSFEHAQHELGGALTDSDLREDALQFLVRIESHIREFSISKSAEAFRGEIGNFVDTHIESVAPRWDDDSVAAVGHSTQLISRLLRQGEVRVWQKKKTDWQDRALASIEQSVTQLPDFIERVKRGEVSQSAVFNHLESYIETAFLSGKTDEGILAATDAFASLFLERKTDSEEQGCVTGMFEKIIQKGFMDSALTESWPKKDAHPGIAVLRRSQELSLAAFEKLGLNPQKFVAAAATTKPEFAPVDLLAESAQSAWRVETSRPGAVRSLSEGFGIQGFGRYPVEMMLHQYDNMDNLDDPYGVVLYPRSDWNGAFQQDSSKEMFGGFLADNIQAEHLLRAYECEGPVDTAKHLIRANHKYGERQKIEYALVGGHANKNSIHQGDDTEPFTKQNVKFGEGFARGMKEFFVPHPTFIFNSCSVGAEDAIGSMFSEIHDTEVFAADKPSSLDRLGAALGEEGRMVFDVHHVELGGALTRHYEGRTEEVIRKEEEWKKELAELF